ncbi:MAG: hypothetical protein V8Q76_14790 [Bacteroides intestinalis]
MIEFIKKHADKEASEITVCFYGGEALLARKKINWIISELKKEFAEKVKILALTNGLALTETVVDWICTFNKFLVNVTLDGNKFMHDKHRRTISGNGSYDVIIKNLELFKDNIEKFTRIKCGFCPRYIRGMMSYILTKCGIMNLY